jgi:hypothetical protein
METSNELEEVLDEYSVAIMKFFVEFKSAANS